VERGSRARWSVAVPTAVFELLFEEAINERGADFPEICPERDDGAIDARLGLAVEKRMIVADVPDQMLAHAFDGTARLRGGRVEPHVFEQYEDV